MVWNDYNQQGSDQKIEPADQPAQRKISNTTKLGSSDHRHQCFSVKFGYEFEGLRKQSLAEK